MSHYVDAIYENGVLRPLEPLQLAERVRVRVESQAMTADEIVARQQQAMRDLDAELANVPDNSPDDGFSSGDHDRVLYGRPA